MEAMGLLHVYGGIKGGHPCGSVAFSAARSSVGVLQRAKPASDSEAESASPLFPDKLHMVFRLRADLRCCFVLRILIGYTAEQVRLLMNLPSGKVEALARTTLARFAELATERRTETG